MFQNVDEQNDVEFAFHVVTADVDLAEPQTVGKKPACRAPGISDRPRVEVASHSPEARKAAGEFEQIEAAATTKFQGFASHWRGTGNDSRNTSASAVAGSGCEGPGFRRLSGRCVSTDWPLVRR